MSEGTTPSTDTERRRQLSLEEFRRLYVRQHQAATLRNRAEAAASPNQAPPHVAAQVQQEQEQQGVVEVGLRAQLMLPLRILGRLFDLFDMQPVARQRLFHDIFSWGVRFISQVLLAALILFSGITPYSICCVSGMYLVWRVLCHLVDSIRIEREAGGGESRPRGVPAGEGEAENGNGTGGPRRRVVSPVGRAMYILTRCVTSFFLSMSPTYSVELLEMELAEDGIVTDFPPRPTRGGHPHQD